MVPIFFYPAARTGIHPFGQWYFLPVSTGGTVLGGIGRIDLLELPTGAFSLVRETGEELRPRRIPNASVQTSVGVHFVDMDVFHEDPSVSIHNFTRFLMRKICSLKSDLFMNPGEDFPGFDSFRRSFLLKFQFSLSLSQPFRRLLEKLRVFYARTIRKCRKGLHPDIDSDREGFSGKTLFRDIFAGKSHPPFPGGRSKNGTGLDLSPDRTMKNDRHDSDLGQAKPVARQIASAIPLRKGDRTVLSLSLEPGIARILSGFHSTKESLKSKVHPHGHILEGLRIDFVQRGFFLLQRRKSPDLIVQRLRNAVPFPRMFPMFQKMVVEPSALLQLPVQKSFLLAGRIQPISEGFSHIVYCVQSSTKVNCTPYLRPEGRSFTAFQDKFSFYRYHE